MLTSPQLPSLLGRYNCSTFNLTVHGDNLSCFLIHFFHFLFCLFNNASTILDSRHHPYVCCLEYILCIYFRFQYCSQLLKVFFPNVFFRLFLTYIPFLQNTKVFIPLFFNLTIFFTIFQLYPIAFNFFFPLHS